MEHPSQGKGGFGPPAYPAGASREPSSSARADGTTRAWRASTPRRRSSYSKLGARAPLMATFRQPRGARFIAHRSLGLCIGFVCCQPGRHGRHSVRNAATRHSTHWPSVKRRLTSFNPSLGSKKSCPKECRHWRPKMFRIQTPISRAGHRKSDQVCLGHVRGDERARQERCAPWASPQVNGRLAATRAHGCRGRQLPRQWASSAAGDSQHSNPTSAIA